MKPVVFVDLELTLIESWHNPILCNVQKLTNWFKANDVKDVHLFSFAVWNEKDKQDFKNDFQDFLQQAFDINFVSVPSVEDFQKVDTKVTGLHFDSLTDFISIRGKVGAFQSWCKHHFQKDNTCFLFDDVVPNCTIEDHDNRLTLHFVNVLNCKGL